MNKEVKFPYQFNDPKLIEKLRTEARLKLLPVGSSVPGYRSEVVNLSKTPAFLIYGIKIQELDKLRESLDFTQYRLFKSLVQERIAEIMEISKHSLTCYVTEEYIMGAYYFDSLIGFTELYKYLSTAHYYGEILNAELRDLGYPSICISSDFFYSDEAKKFNSESNLDEDGYVCMNPITHEDEARIVFDMPSVNTIMTQTDTLEVLYGDFIPGAFLRIEGNNYSTILPNKGLFDN